VSGRREKRERPQIETWPRVDPCGHAHARETERRGHPREAGGGARASARAGTSGASIRALAVPDVEAPVVTA
jgi:hypothetical protein